MNENKAESAGERKDRRSGTKVLRTCADCGAEFMGCRRAKYCPDCRGPRYAGRNRLTGQKRTPQMKTRICRQCGASFEAETAKQYCLACREAKKAEQQQARKDLRSAIVRYCRGCGIAMQGSRHALLCPTCKAEGKRSRESTGSCVI